MSEWYICANTQLGEQIVQIRLATYDVTWLKYCIDSRGSMDAVFKLCGCMPKHTIGIRIPINQTHNNPILLSVHIYLLVPKLCLLMLFTPLPLIYCLLCPDTSYPILVAHWLVFATVWLMSRFHHRMYMIVMTCAVKLNLPVLLRQETRIFRKFVQTFGVTTFVCHPISVDNGPIVDNLWLLDSTIRGTNNILSKIVVAVQDMTKLVVETLLGCIPVRLVVAAVFAEAHGTLLEQEALV